MSTLNVGFQGLKGVVGTTVKKLTHPHFSFQGQVASSSDTLYLVSDFDVKGLIKAVRIFESLSLGLKQSGETKASLEPLSSHQISYFEQKSHIHAQRLKALLNMLLIDGEEVSGMSLYDDHVKSHLKSKLTDLIVASQKGASLDSLLKAIDLPVEAFKNINATNPLTGEITSTTAVPVLAQPGSPSDGSDSGTSGSDDNSTVSGPDAPPHDVRNNQGGYYDHDEGLGQLVNYFDAYLEHDLDHSHIRVRRQWDVAR